MLGVFQLCCMRISVPLGCCLVEIVIAASFAMLLYRSVKKKKVTTWHYSCSGVLSQFFFVAPF